MKIGPHLHRIGNDIVAAYLIDTEEGVTVIDAGLPGHWRDFQRELAAMGRTKADVRGIVLTGRAGAQPAPFTDAPDEALASLARLADVKAGWVLPGHGTPWKVSPGEVEAHVREGGR